MNQLFRKIIGCGVAAFVFCASFVAVPMQKAQAGPASYLAEKIGGEVLDIVDGWVVDGLDYASKETGYNIFSRIGNLISLDDTHGVEKLCNEILGTLGSIESKIDALSANLDKQIAELETYIKSYNWSGNASALAGYEDKYTTAYDWYQNYLSAARDYAQADGDTAKQAQALSDMDFYENKFAAAFDPAKTSDSIDFDSDLREMAKLACKYFPRYVRNDPNAPLSPTHATTTLDSANAVCDSTLAFEHQKYDMLRNQANDCMAAFMKVMIVNRVWTDYNASKTADGNAPADVLAQQQITANEAMQAINDVAAQGMDLAGGLMRAYDTEINLTMNYTPSSTHVQQNTPHKETVPLSATPAVTEVMPVYQLKAIGQPSSVAILKRNDGHPFTHGTLSSDECQVKYTFGYHYSINTASQDYLNVMRDRAGNYSLLSDGEGLRSLVNAGSYPFANNNIETYLTGIGGLPADKLPRNMDTAITSVWRDAYTQVPIQVDGWVHYYFHYTYINNLTSYSLNQSDKDMKKRTVEQVADLSNSSVNGYWVKNIKWLEPLVMLRSAGTPVYTLSTDNAAVIEVEADPGDIVRNGDVHGEGMRIKAGSPIKITLRYTSDVSDVALMNMDGNRLETLITPSEKDWVTHNDDGTITVKTAMPYQDCRIWWATHQEESGLAQAQSPAPKKAQAGAASSEAPSPRIASFDDLKKAAQAVRDHPEKYAAMDFTLAADVDAGGAQWTIPIGSEAHPYTGTFDGNGHTISGLIITKEAGGLFGCIGKEGTVKNLHLYDTDVSAGEGYAGTIAAVNEGTLRYCRAGAGHLLMDAAQEADIDADLLDDMNVHVDAQGTAGGLVGKNAGELLNCSTTAIVKAQTAGGLAGENAGTIRNSFGAAIAEITGETYSGGVAGTNSGTLKNVYFGGDTEGEKDGAIAGKQEGGSADACYYDDTLDEPAGEGQLAAQAVRLSDMRLDEFANRLNEKVSDGAYFWQRSDGANLGLPFIEDDPYCERTLADDQTGVAVSGESIHAAAGLSVVPLAETDEAYQTMAQQNEGLSGAYDIKLNLPPSAAGEAFTGTLDIAFPGGDADAETVAILHEQDGTYHTLEAKKGEDGNYHVTVNSLSAFGIVEQPEEAVPAAATAAAQPSSLWTVLLIVLAGIAAGAAVCVIVIRRGRKKTD